MKPMLKDLQKKHLYHNFPFLSIKAVNNPGDKHPEMRNLLKDPLHRTIFDNTDTGYLLIDKEFTVISFNERVKLFAQRELGQEIGLGDHSLDYFSPVRKPVVKKMMEDAFLGRDISYETNYPQADGSMNWYFIHMFAVPDRTGHIFAITLSVNDITERKLAEEELKRLNDVLKKRAAELDASNGELEKFAYIVSHDLQEPLRMVTGFLQLLQKKYSHQLDADAHKYIDFAVNGADRMKILIGDLLEFSRINSVKKTHSLINLDELVRKTLQLLQTTIDESKGSVEVSALPQVWGNETQLMQLFQNLIGNALKYRNGSDPLIRINYTEKDNAWEFCIQDNGIGIAPEHFDKIFVIFQRLHNRNDYSGTGIGLAVCKKIVELHEGRIWVESAEGKGSSFYFSIPKQHRITKN
jgi:PAS domain S-box-containing protein